MIVDSDIEINCALISKPVGHAAVILVRSLHTADHKVCFVFSLDLPAVIIPLISDAFCIICFYCHRESRSPVRRYIYICAAYMKLFFFVAFNGICTQVIDYMEIKSPCTALGPVCRRTVNPSIMISMIRGESILLCIIIIYNLISIFIRPGIRDLTQRGICMCMQGNFFTGHTVDRIIFIAFLVELFFLIGLLQVYGEGSVIIGI